MPAPKRNKDAASGLKSSANGGQFAHKAAAPADVALSRQVHLPPGAENIPDPEEDQLLLDGSPAPATFPEAWAKTFAPLHAFKDKYGHMPRTAQAEAAGYCFKTMGLDRLNFGDYSTRIVDEKLGSILRIHSALNERECAHLDEPRPDCQDLGCGCPHCILMHAGKLPGVLDVEEDCSEAPYWSDADDDYYVAVEFKIPDEVRERARQLAAEAEALSPLTVVHNQAAKQPWLILKSDEQFAVADDPRWAEANEFLATAEANAEPYRGIYPNGGVDFTYARENPGSLAKELDKIRDALSTFALPPRKRGENAAEKRQGTIDYYRRQYESHRKTLEDIATVEQQLGAQLPDSVRSAAIEKDRFAHDRYDFGFLRGRERVRELTEQAHQAFAEVETAKTRVKEMNNAISGQLEWGRGWPGHPLEAPTRAEWAEITGVEEPEPWL